MKTEGKRIFLRPWRQSDAGELQQLADDKSIARFTRVPWPYKAGHAKKFIKESKEKWRKKQEFRFAIRSKKGKKLFGSVGILRIDRRDRNGEIGFWLGKGYRGQGYMGEAIRLLLRFAFKKLKLNRVAIKCSTKNKASRKVIEKAGAKFEGIERESIKSGLGKMHDLRVYSILAREYERKDI